LIPLKTTQEVRQDHTITHAYITRAPTRQANDVITYATSKLRLHLLK
jgi:tRNA-specific adenosine deaminase 3